MSVLRDYAAAIAQPTLPLAPASGGRFDEVVGADGALRPAWKGLASIAVDLTPAELGRVDSEITTLLADDGVTYGNPESGSQPWQLDPMPLVLDAATWARLEVGLAQRAELLNALLADIYGEQRLLADGVIPSAVVFGHSGYTRPIARPRGFDPHPLVLSGTDLGRDAAGEWRVLADRVQAPSGIGYAMENRRVISRVLPELYHEAGLHRMEPYFSALRSALLQSAPRAIADPRVVVLSPGTHSETAYDQAFVANALGFPLVQGSDLVVRDGWVWMKPSGWPRHAPLERVDVILRRVDAAWCDPLELRADSQLGVAGLTEAVRRGRVRLVNGLGAGVLENPGLLPFLPAVCERCSASSCGCRRCRPGGAATPTSSRAVLAGSTGDPLGHRAHASTGAPPLAGLASRRLARGRSIEPHRFVGQERLPLSQAPTWETRPGHGPRARAATSCAPSPSATARRTARSSAGSRRVRDRTRAPARRKDVWVLKARRATPIRACVEVAPLPTRTRPMPVLAPRALEDMFWSGRYAERTEDLVRLRARRERVRRQLDSARVHAGRRRRSRRCSARCTACAGTRWHDPDAEFRSLLLDAGRAGSAAHSLARLRDAMEGVRDQLSVDTWRVFGTIDRAIEALRGSPHAPRSPSRRAACSPASCRCRASPRA